MYLKKRLFLSHHTRSDPEAGKTGDVFREGAFLPVVMLLMLPELSN